MLVMDKRDEVDGILTDMLDPWLLDYQKVLQWFSPYQIL
jgi:hypothetical protein